jgi:hypothetical protein
VHLEDYLSVSIAEGVKWKEATPILAGPYTVDPANSTIRLGKRTLATIDFQVVPLIDPEAHHLAGG